jgi:hypothetical protein
MNSHLGHRVSRTADPEYLHTVEAIISYLDHLTPEGFLNIEEAGNKPQPFATKLKLTSTLIEALKRYGVTKPGNHLYIFSWGKNNTYTQFFIKKTPFTNDEIQRLEEWRNRIDANTKIAEPFITKTMLNWSPSSRGTKPFIELIEKENLLTTGNWNLEYVTDDRPFPFDVRYGRDLIKKPVYYIVCFVLIFVTLPSILIAIYSYKKRSLTMGIPILYFMISGISYIFIEIVLIQKFQLFLGIPIVSFITVLGGMLVFSGLGSLAAPRLKFIRFEYLIVGIGIMSFITLYSLPFLILRLSFLPLIAKIIVSLLLLFPLSFLMGMPFPSGLSIVKDRYTNSAASLFFALNAAFSALGTTIIKKR